MWGRNATENNVKKYYQSPCCDPMQGCFPQLWPLPNFQRACYCHHCRGHWLSLDSVYCYHPRMSSGCLEGLKQHPINITHLACRLFSLGSGFKTIWKCRNWNDPKIHIKQKPRSLKLWFVVADSLEIKGQISMKYQGISGNCLAIYWQPMGSTFGLLTGWMPLQILPSRVAGPFGKLTLSFYTTLLQFITRRVT